MTVIIISSLLFTFCVFVGAFSTDKCDHGNVTRSLRDLHYCMDDNEIEDGDVCTGFQGARNCAFDNMKKCFEDDDIEGEAKNLVAQVKNFQIKSAAASILLNLSYQKNKGFYLTEDEVESMFPSCQNVPDVSFVENLETMRISGLQALSTDKNCTNQDLKSTDYMLSKCFKDENKNVKKQRNKFMNSRRESRQSPMCSLLSETVGKCLNLTLPSCLSEREKSFIWFIYKKKLRNEFKALDDFLKTKKSGFTFSSCSIFLYNSSLPQSASTIFVFLVIVLLKIINF